MKNWKKCVGFVWLLMLVLAISSCSKSDEYQLTEEEKAWASENEEFIKQKKALLDEKGDPLYKQLEKGGFTILYRTLHKGDENATIRPVPGSTVGMILSGTLIDGRVFQSETGFSGYPYSYVSGLAAVLLESTKDETVEAIIPSYLGYGYLSYGPIPANSTLIFKFTIKSIK